MLFEAGALAQHGDQPTLFTYLYGVGEFTGPLSHFQATRFDHDDTRRLVLALSQLFGAVDDQDIRRQFDETWPLFEATVVASTLLPVQELLPEFPDLFDRMMFDVPLAECSDMKWGDRVRRTAQTHGFLSGEHIAAILSSDPYLRGAYNDLLSALDRYGMHIGAHLLKPVDFADLSDRAQSQLEDARKRILDIIFTLQKQCPPPIFRESLAFESERATDRRKAQIHELEGRLRKGDIPTTQLQHAQASLNWALDRIMYYIACGAGLLSDIRLDDLVAALKGEEERARTRNLMNGLQPLYYAAQCIDQKLPAQIDEGMASRLLEVIGEIEHFLSAHKGRDSGGHIKRRLASIRGKLGKAVPI